MEITKDIEEHPSSIDIEHVKIRMLEDERMTRREAAKYLGVCYNHISNFLCYHKDFPPDYLIGRKSFYFKKDLDAYIQSRRRKQNKNKG